MAYICGEKLSAGCDENVIKRAAILNLYHNHDKINPSKYLHLIIVWHKKSSRKSEKN